MNTIADIKKIPLLKTIEEPCLTQLVNKKSLRQVVYPKGSAIHFEGDRCTCLELVLFGCVSVERIDEEGNLLIVTELSQNDFLGGSILFSRNPYYPMTVIAKADTKLLVMGKTLVLDLCSTNHQFLEAYLQYMSDHTLILGDKIKHYINRSIREGVIAYLNQEYIKQKQTIIRLSITKKALAERMGIQRTSLSRELQKMKQEGLIEFDNRTVTLLAPILKQL